MSDQTVMRVVRDEIDRVPIRHGNLDAVVKRGLRRRRTRRIVGASGVVLVATMAFGLVSLIQTPPVPVGTGGNLDLELVPGFLVRVIDSPISSHGALVYEARPAPIGGLDVDQLGTEIVITQANPGEFVVPISDNPRNALQADRVIYLGDLAGAQLALHAFNDSLCVFLGNGTDVTGGGSCVTDEGLAGGEYVDPPVGEWLAWTRLPESVAVVVGETTDGTSYWQRVTGRTVVFILPDGTTVDPTSLSALDADGNEVATTRGMILDLSEIGFPPCPAAPAEEAPLIDSPVRTTIGGEGTIC
jgi:hypothetical protein